MPLDPQTENNGSKVNELLLAVRVERKTVYTLSTGSGDVARVKWPSTNLEFLSASNASPIVVHEKVPQMKAGIVHSDDVEVAAFSYEILKGYGIDHPSVLSDASNARDTFGSQRYCTEGLPFSQLRAQLQVSDYVTVVTLY